MKRLNAKKSGSDPNFLRGAVWLLSFVSLPVFGQLPPVVTLEDVLRIVSESPRVAVSQREAVLSLARIDLPRAAGGTAERAAVIAALAGATQWRPRAQGSLELPWKAEGDLQHLVERSPTLQTARAETRAAEARIELAQRE